jgi:RNA polymerase sigma-70 factor (ECF subfamily)
VFPRLIQKEGLKLKGNLIGEKQLAAMCSKGSKEARRELYDIYAEGLYAICLRYLPDKEMARDTLHDSFIRVFDKIGHFSYCGEGSLKAWMSRITSNMAIDVLRKAKKSEFLSMDDETPADIPFEEDSPDADNVPEETLMKMIESLPEGKRTIFNMHCIDGYSHKEIAKRCRITEKGSASILAKARKELAISVRKYLKENG